MPIETEELQLRVTLDDAASAQLAALRGQLDQMRGAGSATAQVQQAAPQIVAAIADATQQLTAMAEQLKQLPTQITGAMSATVQGLAQVQGQLTQISTQIQQSAQAVAGIPGRVKAGSEGLSTAIRQAGFFGGIAGGATAELVSQLTKLGNNLVERATDFHGLADSMKDLQTHAVGVGQSLTGYQGLERQLELIGMSEPKAKGAISRAADISGELKQYGAENAPITHRLLANIKPDDRETSRYIFEMMKQMEGAPLQKQINLWIELRENMQKTMTLAHRGEQFEAAWKEISEKAGFDPDAFGQVEKGGRVKQEPPDPAREQLLTARTEETKNFNKESKQALFYWKDIGESLAGSLLHGFKLNRTTEELNTWLARARGELETFERVYRDTGDFEKAVAALDPALAPFAKELHDLAADISKIGPDIKAWKDYFAEQFSALTEFWNSLPEGLRDMLSGKSTLVTHHEAPPQISGREPTALEKIDVHSNYSIYERMKQEGYTDDQIRSYFEKYKNSPPEHAWTPLQHELGLGHQPGAPEPATPPPATVTPPAPPPPPPPGPTELTPEQQERLQRHYRRGGVQRQSYEEGAGQPITVTPAMVQAMVESAQPEVGGQPSGLHEGMLQLAGYKSRMAGRVVGEMAGQLTAPRGLLRSGVDVGQMAKGGLDPKAPTIAEGMLSGLPFGLGIIPELLKQHEGAGDPLLKILRERLGIPDADVPAPAPWAKGGAWHQQDDASSFENRFGVWPSTGAEKIDSTSSKLDQAANSNVNISGAGKIQVDVRAPPGTSVDASSEGFFKSTEITRLTQMYPADMGPLPMTGVGTGQGPSGNSTVS